MHYSAIYNLFGQERGEGGREEIKVIRGSSRVLLAKPFTNGGFYIAPEEETDKEKI